MKMRNRDSDLSPVVDHNNLGHPYDAYVFLIKWFSFPGIMEDFDNEGKQKFKLYYQNCAESLIIYKQSKKETHAPYLMYFKTIYI